MSNSLVKHPSFWAAVVVVTAWGLGTWALVVLGLLLAGVVVVAVAATAEEKP